MASTKLYRDTLKNFSSSLAQKTGKKSTVGDNTVVKYVPEFQI